MSYEKQTWVTGEVITQEKLNHIEDGIENMSSETNFAVLTLGIGIDGADYEPFYPDRIYTFNEVDSLYRSGTLIIVNLLSQDRDHMTIDTGFLCRLNNYYVFNSSMFWGSLKLDSNGWTFERRV